MTTASVTLNANSVLTYATDPDAVTSGLHFDFVSGAVDLVFASIQPVVPLDVNGSTIAYATDPVPSSAEYGYNFVTGSIVPLMASGVMPLPDNRERTGVVHFGVSGQAAPAPDVLRDENGQIILDENGLPIYADGDSAGVFKDSTAISVVPFGVDGYGDALRAIGTTGVVSVGIHPVASSLHNLTATAGIPVGAAFYGTHSKALEPGAHIPVGIDGYAQQSKDTAATGHVPVGVAAFSTLEKIVETLAVVDVGVAVYSLLASAGDVTATAAIYVGLHVYADAHTHNTDGAAQIPVGIHPVAQSSRTADTTGHVYLVVMPSTNGVREFSTAAIIDFGVTVSGSTGLTVNSMAVIPVGVAFGFGHRDPVLVFPLRAVYVSVRNAATYDSVLTEAEYSEV